MCRSGSSAGFQDDGGMSAAFLSGVDEAERPGAQAGRETGVAEECLDGRERGR